MCSHMRNTYNNAYNDTQKHAMKYKIAHIMAQTMTDKPITTNTITNIMIQIEKRYTNTHKQEYTQFVHFAKKYYAISNNMRKNYN